MFFNGYSDDFSYEYKGEKVPTIKYLGRKFGILPEFFVLLEAHLMGEENDIPDIMTNVFSVAQSMGSNNFFVHF